MILLNGYYSMVAEFFSKQVNHLHLGVNTPLTPGTRDSEIWSDCPT